MCSASPRCPWPRRVWCICPASAPELSCVSGLGWFSWKRGSCAPRRVCEESADALVIAQRRMRPSTRRRSRRAGGLRGVCCLRLRFATTNPPLLPRHDFDPRTIPNGSLAQGHGCQRQARCAVYLMRSAVDCLPHLVRLPGRDGDFNVLLYPAWRPWAGNR